MNVKAKKKKKLAVFTPYGRRLFYVEYGQHRLLK
jgi:hypothetical protein